MSAESKPKRRKLVLILVLSLVSALLVGAAAWCYRVYEQIQLYALQDQAAPADAIGVLGAAEYDGRPSPVYRARLDHALVLYHRGLAPLIITLGGPGGDQYNEGSVGADYLISKGVPEQDIIAETQADNTDESVERVAAIMNTNGLHTCIAVSDGYHIFRIKKMLERQGFTVYGAPRPQARPPSKWHETVLILREIVSYAVWRIESLSHWAIESLGH